MPGRTTAARMMATACRWVDRRTGRDEVPIVVLVDAEPDGRSLDRSDEGAWKGFERLVELLPALRERLAVATGAPAALTWGLRMDPQIARVWGSAGWLADGYADARAALQREGD